MMVGWVGGWVGEENKRIANEVQERLMGSGLSRNG